SVTIDSVLLSWIALQACLAMFAALASRSIRSFAALFAVVAVIEAFLFSRPWVGRLMLLSGGDDWLTYETYARDLVLHGPLMTLGRPLGMGEPFYYQPLYPYVLAGLHWLFGEGFFAIVYIQRLLVAVSVAFVWRLTHVLFGARIGLVGLAVALVVLYDKLGPWAPILLGEIVFIPLVCAWALSLIQLGEPSTSEPSTGRIVYAGILGGLGTLSRSTLLLAWPLVGAVLIAVRVRHRPGPWSVTIAPVLAAFAIMLAVVGLATARNWVVAHRFVPVTTTFSTDLLVGNRPPPSVTISPTPADTGSLLARIAPDDNVRVVLEFARQAPRAFIRNLVNKALYVLGFFGAYTEEGRPVPILIATWMAALLGAGLLVFAPVDAGIHGGARAIPGLIALSHFAALVLIFPHVYGDRLVLPFYALVLPYAAVAVSRIFPTMHKS
ncbi:MAG TPA: glycosyltransferase family 39 protein, partial [Vicinamibacterales bacterium]|nr:glycosyltransferase family 39 protein [Vicinamibacterales bacterium]